MAQSELVVALRLGIDQRFDAESLNEALQLALRHGPLYEVHEVRADPALGEKTKRLACACALLSPKNLDFHLALG